MKDIDIVKIERELRRQKYFDYAHDSFIYKHVNIKIRNLLKQRINYALKSSKTTTNSESLLGCTTQVYKDYISNLFEPDMTWDNRDVKTWHLDHIIPISSFNLRDKKTWPVCFNFRNTQPMFALMNKHKSYHNLHHLIEKLVIVSIKRNVTHINLSNLLDIPLDDIRNWEKGISEPNEIDSEKIRRFIGAFAKLKLYDRNLISSDKFSNL